MFTESELKLIDEGNLQNLINLYNKSFLLSYKNVFIERVLLNNKFDFISWLFEDEERSEYFRKSYFPDLIHLSLRTGNLEIIEKQFPSFLKPKIVSSEIEKLKYKLNKSQKYYSLIQTKDYLKGCYKSIDSDKRIKLLEILIKYTVHIDIPSKFNKETALHLAVQCKQLKDIEFLIKNGASIYLKNLEGKSSIHFAYENGIIEKLITIYLKYGGNLHAEDDDGYTLLAISIFYNSLPVINFILKQGYNINHKNKHGSSALHFASMPKYKENWSFDLNLKENKMEVDEKENNKDADEMSESVKIFKILLDSGCNLSGTDDEGYSPFMIAAKNNFLEVINFILNSGYDVNHKNEDGYTALYYAALELQNLEIIKLLLQFGADPDILYTKRQYNLLYFILNNSCEKNDFVNNAVKLLVENGATVEFKIINGLSILHTAVIKNYSEAAKTLLNKSTETINDLIQYDLISEWRYTCVLSDDLRLQYFPGTERISILDIAVMNNDKKLVQFLIGKVEDFIIERALFFSIIYTKFNILRLFLHNGIDISNKIFNGIPILHAAILIYSNSYFYSYMGINLLYTLLFFNADINAKDINNQTPFSLAISVQNKNKEIHQKLLPYIIFLYKENKYYHENEQHIYQQINTFIDTYDKKFDVLKKKFLFNNISLYYIFSKSVNTLANILPSNKELLCSNYIKFVEGLPFSDMLKLKLEFVFERKELIDFANQNFDFIFKNVPYFIKRSILQYLSLIDLKNLKIAIKKRIPKKKESN